MTVEPLSMITESPVVIETVPTHSQVIPVVNVRPFSTTAPPEQSGQGGGVSVGVAVGVAVGVLVGVAVGVAVGVGVGGGDRGISSSHHKS